MPKYYKREMPDLTGTGEQRYYYEVRSEGVRDTAELTRRLHRNYRAMSEAELRGIVGDLIREVADSLAEGYSVSLDGLGSFALSLGLAPYDPATATARQGGEPNARRIHVRDVNFKAQRRFVQDVDDLCRGRFVRDDEGLRPVRRPLAGRDERVRLALQHVRANGLLRTADYVRLTGLSHTTACRELRQLWDDPSVPLRAVGRGSHRVYVEDRPQG